MDSSPADEQLDSERVRLAQGQTPGQRTYAHARTLRTVTDMRNSSSMDGPANATHHERTRGEEGGSEENREWADEEERGLEAGDCSTPVVEWLAGEKRDGRLN